MATFTALVKMCIPLNLSAMQRQQNYCPVIFSAIWYILVGKG